MLASSRGLESLQFMQRLVKRPRNGKFMPPQVGKCSSIRFEHARNAEGGLIERGPLPFESLLGLRISLAVAGCHLLLY